jgi:hypothetical protein
MSQKLKCKNLKGIKIWLSWLFLLAIFCFLSVPTVHAQSGNRLDGKFLKAWIKGNGKQIDVNNGKLKVAKLKKKENVMDVKLVAFDCDAVEKNGTTPNDCDGYCYYIINLKPDSEDNCEEENIGELYTCGSAEEIGSAIISKSDDTEDFEAAIITKHVFRGDDTLKKLESKAGSGKIDDIRTSIVPDYVFKNLLLKATEIAEADLRCTPETEQAE